MMDDDRIAGQFDQGDVMSFHVDAIKREGRRPLGHDNNIKWMMSSMITQKIFGPSSSSSFEKNFRMIDNG